MELRGLGVILAICVGPMVPAWLFGFVTTTEMLSGIGLLTAILVGAQYIDDYLKS